MRVDRRSASVNLRRKMETKNINDFNIRTFSVSIPFFILTTLGKSREEKKRGRVSETEEWNGNGN